MTEKHLIAHCKNRLIFYLHNVLCDGIQRDLINLTRADWKDKGLFLNENRRV